MGLFKALAVRGADYISADATDFDVWSRLMIEDCGINVMPFLREILPWSVAIAQRRKGAQPMKINCWEFKRCGREEGGHSVPERDICPVYLHASFDGIHGGRNGGRACWAFENAQCGNRIQRGFIPRFLVCGPCEFKRAVIAEERPDLIISDGFLKMLAG